MSAEDFLVHGPIVQAGTRLGEVEVLPDAWVGVHGATGRVAFVSTTPPPPAQTEWAHARVVDVPKGGFLTAGFVDTHIHAPQYAFAGVGTNRPLLEWLNAFTFPFESRCADVDGWARRVYGAVVRRTLAAGTTTAAYFATIHAPASVALAEICAAHGQRAFV